MIDLIRNLDAGGWISYTILTIGMLLASWFVFCEVLDMKNKKIQLVLSIFIIFGGYHLLIFLSKLASR